MTRRALVLLALAALPASATELRSSVELGVDSFIQRFRLADTTLAADIDAPELTVTSLRDTTEVFSEYRTLLELALLDEDEDDRVDLRVRGSLGSERLLGAATLEARMGAVGGPTRLDMAAAVEARQFRSGSDFALQSDGSEFQLRLHGRRRLSEQARGGLRLKFSQESFEEQSEFELDNWRLDGSTTLEFERDFDLFGQLELGAGWRDVPDSNQISHRRGFAHGDLQWQGLDWSFALRGGFERRDYEDPATRSPYWNLLVEPTLARRLGERWRLALHAAHEFLDYDEDSSIYFDSGIGRVGMELRHQRLSWSLAVEPRFGWLDAPGGIEDRYRQPSLLARFDWLGSGRLWLSLSEEVGHRDYAEIDSEYELYSDYWFLRTTLLASMRLAPWLSLEAFLSDEPEAHRNAEDDGRLTLFSASLRATL